MAKSMSVNMRKCLNTIQHLELNGNNHRSNAVLNMKDDQNNSQFCISYCNQKGQMAFTAGDDEDNSDINRLTIDRGDGLVTVYRDLSVLNNLNVNGNTTVQENLTVEGKLTVNGYVSKASNSSETFQNSMLKTGLENGVLVESVRFVHYLCEGFLEIELTKDLPENYRDCRDMVLFDYFVGRNASAINGKAFMLRFKESCGTCDDDKNDVNRKIIFVPTRELGVRSGIEMPSVDDHVSQPAVYRLRSRDEYLSQDQNAGLTFFYVDETQNNAEGSNRIGEFGNNNSVIANRSGNIGVFGNSSGSQLQERGLVYDMKEDCWKFLGKVKIDSNRELHVSKISNKTDEFESKGAVNIDGPTNISDDLDVEGDLNLDGDLNGNGEQMTVGLSDGKSYLTLNNDNTVLKSEGDLTLDAEEDILVRGNNFDLCNIRGDLKLNEETFIMFGACDGANEPTAYINNQKSTLSLVDCSQNSTETNDDEEQYGIQFLSKNKDIILHPRSENDSDENGSVVIKGDLQCVNFYAHGMLSHSDATLKTDIKNMNISLVDNLMNLRPVSYKWRENKKQDLGFIAQEVEELFPEFVATDSNGIKAIDYSKLVSVLTLGLQNQQRKINELTKLVENLISQ